MTINTGTLSIGTAHALSGGVLPVLLHNVANTYSGVLLYKMTATLLTNGFNLTVGSLGGVLADRRQHQPVATTAAARCTSSSRLPRATPASSPARATVYIKSMASIWPCTATGRFTGGVTHDVTNLQGNHTDSPKSYLPFAIAANSAQDDAGHQFRRVHRPRLASTIFGRHACRQQRRRHLCRHRQRRQTRALLLRRVRARSAGRRTVWGELRPSPASS